jgi:hypothetical protein
MPYAAGTKLYVFDLLGLADPFTARLETRHWTTLLPYAGHEKELPRPWIAARLLPEDFPVRPAQLPNGGLFSLIPPVFGPALEQQIEYARAVWECPVIRRLRDSSESKLTVGRFLRNIVDSFANTRLRIPPDPETAYRKFCGGKPRAALGTPHASTSATGLDAMSSSRAGAVSVERTVRHETAEIDCSGLSLPRHVVSLAGFV